MKIVFLDTKTIGDGILLESLEKEGELEVHQITSPEQTANRIKDAEVVITNKVEINIGDQELAGADKLRLICVAATGYNNVDLSAAKKKGVIVANVSGYSSDSVAQTVLAYILALYNSVIKYDQSVKSGDWSKSRVFTSLKYPISELSGKTIGIIGYGDIGRKVGEITAAFGAEIIAATRPDQKYKEDFRLPLPELLQQSDIVTIHAPLSDETEGLIGAKELKMMKSDAILINAARGGIVNEDDLYQALKKKEIKAAAIDVMKEEPPVSDSKLFGLDNIIITPHIGWATRESRQRLLDGIVDNIRQYKAGQGAEIDLCQKVDC